MIGRTVAHYKILEELGSGGMGVVYRARDEQLDREVALKLLPPRVVDDLERLQRFEREARAVAALIHPNIVTIYSIEKAEGHRFITMELVNGSTLERVVPAGGLPLGRFFELGIALADAVSAAHERGIVHRDLKPGNVMVDARRGIKILDFGLAKLLDAPAEEPPSTEAPTEARTEDGQVVGTVRYMSPEQLRGIPADHRSDIFSLGVLLYHMATGRHPFAAATTVDVTSSILRDSPSSVSELRAELPRQLSRIIGLALEKDPERRFQSAKDLRNELEALRAELSTSSVVAPVPQLERSRKPALWAGAAAVTVVGALAGWQLWPRAEPPTPAYLAVAGVPRLDVGQTAASAVPELARRRLASALDLFVIGEQEDPRADLVLHVDSSSVEERMRVGYRLERRRRGADLGGTIVEGPRAELIALIDRIGEDVAERASAAVGRRVRFEPPTETGPDSEALEPLLLGLGRIHGEPDLDDLEAATEHFRRALEIDGDLALAHALAGRTLVLRYELEPARAALDDALSACREAMRLDDRLADGWACAGDSLSWLDRPLEAVEHYVHAISLEPTLIRAYEGIRAAHRTLRHPEEALRTWRRVIELHPTFWAGHLYLGGFHFREGDYELAIANYRRALELAPENAKTQVSLGGSYYFLGRWEEAVQALQRSIQLRPTFEGHSNLGSTYFILRRFDEAVGEFEHAARFDDADYRTHGNLAKAYYWSGREAEASEAFRSAIQLCERRLAVQPRDADAMILMAHYLAMSGDSESSLGMLARAMRARPDDPHYAYLAGLVHSQLGNNEEALDWLEAAGREGYSMAEMRNTIELDGLRDEPRFRALLASS